MNLGQVIQKASVAYCRSGRCSKDHFVDVAGLIPRSRLLAPKKRNVKCVGVISI